jgi:hypothetical protein
MNNQSINMLFYSNECNMSRQLLVILQSTGLLGYFKLICVDEILNRLPPQITAVPTMIVKDLSKPIVGQDTFEWVNKIKFIRQQQIMDVNKKIIQNNIVNNTNVNKKGPIGFQHEEMTGVSDKFAYTKTDNPTPKTFFGVGEEEKHAIFTAPEQNKISKEEQRKMINDIASRREIQDKEHGELMKEQQLKAVRETENEQFDQNNQQQMQQQYIMQQQMMQQQMMQQQMMQQQMMQPQNFQRHNRR